MARNDDDWGLGDSIASKRTDDAGDWGAEDVSAAKAPLPEGVTPSTAGGGRGSARDPRRLDRDRAAEIRQMDEATEPYSDPATALQRTPQAKPGAFDIPSVLDREGAVLPEPTLSPAQEQANLASSNRAAAERMAPVTGPVAREGDRQKPNRAEDQGRMLSDGGFVTRAAAKAGSAAVRGAWGTVRAGADIVGADRVASVAKESAGATEDFERGMGKAVAPAGFGPRSPIGYLQEMGEGAASSLGTSAAFALAFGPKAVIPLMSIQSAGEKYDQARNQGLDPGMALANAVPTGAFEAIGEKFQGLDKAATALKVLMTRGSSQQAIKSAADALVASGVREIPGEVLTYLGQTGVDLLPGIGINQDLTVGEFLDGLRDTVMQAGMMGGAQGIGGMVANRSAERTPRAPRTAEQIARDKGFLVEQERIKRLNTAGEKEVAKQLQSRLDGQQAQAELEALVDKPYGADPAFQQQYTTLRTAGVKPAEASARAAMFTGFGHIAGQSGMSEKAIARAIETATTMPLDQVPAFLDRFTTLLASKGLATPVPEGTIASTAGALGDDAMSTALANYDDSPADTMASIEQLEQQQAPAAPAQVTANTADAAAPLEPGWEAFPPESGSLGVPRAEMPQIKAEHRGAMVNFLTARGITHRQVEIDPGQLKATQAEFSPERVQQARDFTGGDRSILVSADGHILDGHHQWLAKMESGQPVKAIVLDAPIDHLFDQVRQFPSAEVESQQGVVDGQAPVEAAAPEEAQAAAPADQGPAGGGEAPEADAGPGGAGADGSGSAGPVGRDGTPLAEGGKPFASKKEAQKARKHQPILRMVKVKGGFALVEKTPVQLAAEANAAKRLRVPRTSPRSEPIPAHAYIAAAGGLRRSEAKEMGVEGNVRVGNRALFAGGARGMSIEEAAGELIEAGYLPESLRGDSGLHRAAYDLISRSINNPQYTPEGWEAIANAEREAQFSDYLEASQEQGDPLGPLSDEEMEGVGPLTTGQQDELAALIAIAEAEGVDVETILEEAAKLTQNGDDHDYRQKAIALIGEARASLREAADRARVEQGRPDAQPDGVQGRVPRDGEPSPAPSEVAAPPPVQTPASAGVFTWTRNASGTLTVQGDPDAVVKFLADAGITRVLKAKTGALVGVKDADQAEKILRRQAPKPVKAPVAAKPLSMGITPGSAEPVTVKDGVVFVGKYAAQNFDTGEDVTVPDGATTADIRKALTDAGAVPRRAKFFGGQDAKPDDDFNATMMARSRTPDPNQLELMGESEAEPVLTAPTREEVLDQQRRREEGEKAEAKRKAAEQAKLKAEQERKDIAEASKAAADDFTLGGDAVQNLSGQKGMFARGIWRSELADRLKAATMKTAPAQGWRDFIAGLTTKGVKPDEIEWSGINEWLQLQTGKVTKEQVLAFLDANGVQLEEVTLGGADAADAADMRTLRDAGITVERNPENRYDVALMHEGDLMSAEDVKNFAAEAGWSDAVVSAAKRVEDAEFDHNNPPKYGQYQLPGGTNYREILLTLPPAGEKLYSIVVNGKGPTRYRFNGVLYDTAAEAKAAENAARASEFKSTHWDEPNVLAHIRLNDRETVEPWTTEQLAAISKRAEMTKRADALASKIGKASRDARIAGDVRREELLAELRPLVRAGKMTPLEMRDRLDNAAFSTASDEVAAMIRERDTILDSMPPEPKQERKRILFVEEIQSDWAQQGRKDGFRDESMPERPATYDDIIVGDQIAGWGKVQAIRGDGNAREFNVGGMWIGRAKFGLDKVAARSNTGLMAGPKGNAVPRAPFVEKTDAWLTLALKRIVKLAADEGFDRVAFVNGQQSADRYDLSKHVDSIAYQRNPSDDTYKVQVMGRDGHGSIWYKPRATLKEIEDTLGKEMAERIQRGDGQSTPRDPNYDKLMRGLDLKVGGRGMVEFYDKIVPAAMNKLLGKVGGGKVGPVALSMERTGKSGTPVYDYESGGPVGDRDAGPFIVTDDAGNEVSRFPTRRQAAAEVDRLNASTATEGAQPGFDITPTMREKAAHGLPMFRRDGDVMPSGMTMEEARAQVATMRGMSVADAQAIVKGLKGAWKNGPPVEVVHTHLDLPVEAPADVRGLYHQGKVWIVAGAHKKGKDVRRTIGRTLAHEAIAHFGLRHMLGRDGWKELMGNIQLAIASGNKPLQAARDYVRKAYQNADGSYSLNANLEADEIAAKVIEEAIGEDGKFKPGYSFLKSTWARVAKFLRDLGIDIEFTLAELHGMLVLAQRNMETGKRFAGGGQLAVAAAREDGPMQLRVFHGTPHEFDKFSTSAIGTGEGAQAYGHGLYFAGKREVAEHYRNALTRSRAVEQWSDADGKKIGTPTDVIHGIAYDMTWDFPDENLSASQAVPYVEKAMVLMRDEGKTKADALTAARGNKKLSAAVRMLYDGFSVDYTPPPKGRLYEVEIPEEGQYLLWDRPLSDLPQKYQQAIYDGLIDAGAAKGEINHLLNNKTGADLYRYMSDNASHAQRHGTKTFADIAKFGGRGDEAASKFLRSLGIRGIKYLDGSSRNRTLREVKKEFLAQLPEDAGFDEVMDLIGEGTFSPANEAILKALAADDWLGFDYPAQAISAALGGKLADFDASPALVKAVEDAQVDATFNYVIFDDADVKIEAQFARGTDRTVQVDGIRYPAENSLGQPIHPTFQGQQNFWRWAKGTAVVDDNGRPLVVYHGTDKDFDAFEVANELGNHFGAAGQSNTVTEGVTPGSSFTGARIMPAYLSIKSPLRLQDYGNFMAEHVIEQLLERGITPKDGSGFKRPHHYEDKNGQRELQKIIEAHGYDGVVYLNRREGINDAEFDPNDADFTPENYSDAQFLQRFPDAQDSYIAFSPTQIKSATGNTGDFDGSGNIMFARGEAGDSAGRGAASVVAVNDSARALQPAVGDVLVDRGNPYVDLLSNAGGGSPLTPKERNFLAAFGNLLVGEGVKPAVDERFGEGLVRNAKLLRDLHRAPTFAKQGYSGLDAPGKRAVLLRVGALFQNLKILRAVVESVPVDVVNVLAGQKGAARDGGRDNAMLAARRPVNVDDAIAVVVDKAALVAKDAHALEIAKEAPVLRGRNLAGVTNDAGAAGGAGKGGRGQGGTPTLDSDGMDGGWESPVDSKLDRFIYELQDQKLDLKRVQQAIKKAGLPIAEQFDARQAETLYPGRVARRTEVFLQREARPLLEAMARAKVGMNELGDYLIARHAPERNAQVAKVNPELPDGGAGRNSQGELMTNAAARAYLANLPPERRAQLAELAQHVDRITAGTRGLLVTEGLEKQSTIDAWNGAYSNYVPLFKDEADHPHPQGMGFTVKGPASKRATGSTKEVTHVLAHVLMQREAAIARAEKNRVGLALYGLALSHPNPDFWTTIKPSMTNEQVGQELVRMGVDPTIAAAGMQGIPTIRDVDKVTGKVVDRPNPIYKSLPGAITLRVNGEDRVLLLSQKDERALRMAEALKNLDGLTAFDLAGTIVGKATRWLAAVNTQYNPAFGLVNLTRDTWGGLVNLGSTPLRGKGLLTLARVPLAMQGIARELMGGGASSQWAQLWKQFQDDGGRTGWRDVFAKADERAEAIERELAAAHRIGKLTPGRLAHAALSLLDGFNTTLENAVRLAAYKTALDQGMSRAAGAKLGRELTVDFNRKGRIGRELGPMYAFFNASVQGAARTIETLKGPTGAKIIAGGLTLGMLQALILMAAGYDDDEIPEFVKTRALIIPLPPKEDGEKRFLSIPYPLGLHVIPNTGRVLTELSLNGGKDIGKRTVSAIGEVMGAFNPLGGGNVLTAHGALTTIAPTLVDPVIDIASNKNFAGMPIERESPRGETDNRPGYERAREGTLRSTTGQAYLGISRAFNSLTGGNAYEAGAASPTPERVRYIAQTVGGGVLRELEKTIDASVRAANGEKVKSSGIPVVGRFYGEVDADRVTAARYFKKTRELDKLQTSLAAAKKAGDGEAMVRLVEQHPELALASAQDKIQQRLAKLNRLAVTTVSDPEQMKAIDEARTAEMRAFNEALQELEAGNAKPTMGDKVRGIVKPKEVVAAPWIRPTIPQSDPTWRSP